MRALLVNYLLLAIPVCSLQFAAPASHTPPYVAAYIPPDTLEVRLTSGLTICDEELRNGHWVNRYWMSTGQIKRDYPRDAYVLERLPGPIDSFELAMEGQNLGGTWEWVTATRSELHKPDGLQMTVELRSTARPVTVKIHTAMYGGPVMVRWLEITNRGTKSTAITGVSPWSGILWNTSQYRERLPKDSDAAFQIAYVEDHGFGYEGSWRFEPLVNATRTVSGMRGRSGWGHPSFFARNNATGEWFAASLGWSGNWGIELNSKQDPGNGRAALSFHLGPAAADPALRVLEAGETVRTPSTHLLNMRGQLDDVIQAMHTHVRENVVPRPIPNREYQVEANHRGYLMDHENEPGMKRDIDVAAEIGAEMYVIDAGWYGPDPNQWWNNAGDWYAGSWLPNDITPIREYARKKGLLFGLWVEIEAMGANAKLRQQHPDWAATRNGKPIANGRFLDASKPEVAAWMESELVRIIQKYDLDMYRIDFNTTVEEGGNRVKDGFVESTMWRHVDAIYAMFDRLRKRFPKVIFQNCAAGGGRLDLGMLSRFHNTEMTDWLRGPRDLKILNGMSWLLPPEIMLLTFGTEFSDPATDGDLDFQLRKIMMSRPIFRGIAPSVDNFNSVLKREIKENVSLYRNTIRPIMAGGRVYHHTPFALALDPAPWVVLEYATPDETRAVASFFRTDVSGDPVFQFIPRGLDPSHTYKVTFGNRKHIVEIPGARLTQVGLPVRLDGTMISEMLLFEAK